MTIDHRGSQGSTRATSSTLKTKRGTRTANSRASETLVATSKAAVVRPIQQAQGVVSDRSAWSAGRPVQLRAADRTRPSVVVQFPLDALVAVEKDHCEQFWGQNIRSLKCVPQARASPWRVYGAQRDADNGLDIFSAITVVVLIFVGLGVWLWADVPAPRALPILWNLLRDLCLVALALARMMRSLIGATVTVVNLLLPIAQWMMANCFRLLVALHTAFFDLVQKA
ncbi:hypothetical protein C8Q70DRAFT_1065185 [Cubamyces menziesii]|nr:hypothetical protein C8Q70DRAFT_1065185 [Cubamyces menziesii]